MPKRARKKSRPARNVNTSAARVFDILQHLCRIPQPTGIADIARNFNLPVSSVHRALVTLEESGFATRAAKSSRVQPGLMTHHLIRALLARFPIVNESHGILDELASAWKCTVQIGVAIGWYAVIASDREGALEAGHVRAIGRWSRLHETILGRAILACSSDADIDEYERFIAAHSARVKDDDWSRSLRREAGEARRHGLLIRADGEAAGIGIPIRGRERRVLGALAILAPEGTKLRPSSADVKRLLKTVAALEERIEASNGNWQDPFAHLDRSTIVFALP